MAGTDITFGLKAVDGTRAAFLSVQNSLSRLNKEAGLTKGLFKAGIGVLGAGSLFSLLSRQIREVITDIESIPGIPDKTRQSVVDLRNNFADFKKDLQYYIAAGLAGINTGISKTAEFAGRLIKGNEATDAALDLDRRFKEMEKEKVILAQMAKLRVSLNEAEHQAGLGVAKITGPLLTLGEEIDILRVKYDKLKTELAHVDLTSEANVLRRIEAFKEMGEVTTDLARKIERANRPARELGAALAGSFEDAIFAGGKLRDVINAMISDLARLLFRQVITQNVAGYLGGLFSPVPTGGVGGAGAGGGGGGFMGMGTASSGGAVINQVNNYSSGVQAIQLAQMQPVMQANTVAAMVDLTSRRKV